MKSEQCCGTCIYSRWTLTPKGRLSRVKSGRCVVPLPKMPPLPDSVTKSGRFNPEFARTAIWHEEGSECPLYNLNDGRPIPM